MYPKPITRKEMYLAKAIGEYNAITPRPVTRIDTYLGKICGDWDLPLPGPITREEMYLAKIAGGYDYPTPAPITRVDYFLAAIAGSYDGDLPAPITREEIYLASLVWQTSAVVRQAEGNPILLTDSVAAPFESLKIYGKSTQRTTTGRNLADYRNIKHTVNGITLVGDENGVVTLSGQATGGMTVFLEDTDMTLFELGKTYTSIDSSLEWRLSDGTAYYGTREFTENVTAIRPYIQKTIDNFVNGEVLYPMVVEYGSEGDFEPFTGGVPSPSIDYPQEIVNVGNSGEIGVQVTDGNDRSEIATFLCPNGLPGIPVSSGGNYTDEDGQQWIADCIDCESGEYVKNFEILNAKDTSWDDSWNNVFPGEYTHVFKALPAVFLSGGYCNSLPYDSLASDIACFSTAQGNGQLGVRVPKELADTVEEWTAYVNEHDIIFALPLKEPVRTPLTEEEISQYKALRTYSPSTTIANDAGAHMEVSYKAEPISSYRL